MHFRSKSSACILLFLKLLRFLFSRFEDSNIYLSYLRYIHPRHCTILLISLKLSSISALCDYKLLIDFLCSFFSENCLKFPQCLRFSHFMLNLCILPVKGIIDFSISIRITLVSLSLSEFSNLSFYFVVATCLSFWRCPVNWLFLGLCFYKFWLLSIISPEHSF